MNKCRKFLDIYVDGFRNLTLGKVLWKIVILKLIIIFTLLNFYIYDKSINSEFKTESQRIAFVYKNITKD